MRSSMEWRNVTVVNSVSFSDTIKIIEFQVEHSLIPFEPGSHVTFKVHINNQPQDRSYTCLPSDTDNGRVRIAVKLSASSRGGSEYMHSLQAGNAIQMTLPENRFELSRGSKRYLLIAGGIGITPIYGMVSELARRSADFRVLYAAASKKDMLFADEMTQSLGDRLELFSSTDGHRIDLLKEISLLDKGDEVYFCGPLSMLDDARRIWRAQGHEMKNFRFEMFGDSGTAPAEMFEVVVPAHNKTLHVARDQTLLQALENAGVPLIYDCNRGECGLCSVSIIETEQSIDHRDVFFSEEEKAQNDKMCACVSRAVGGKVVIDTGYRP